MARESQTEWFHDFMSRWKPRRWSHRKKKSSPRVETTKKADQVAEDATCWFCKERDVATGDSSSSLYARANGLCYKCYLDGIRRG